MHRGDGAIKVEGPSAVPVEAKKIPCSPVIVIMEVRQLRGGADLLELTCVYALTATLSSASTG